MMLIALLLILIGIFFILVNPILGSIPGLVLIAMGLAALVLGIIFRGLGAFLRVGPKTCPDCRSKIPSRAVVCRYCGYRYMAT